MDYKEMSAPQLVSEWDTPTDFVERDKLVSVILAREQATREAWPSAAVAKREEMAGLYPDPADPHFAARLYAKREFHEARAVVAGVAEGVIDPCTSKAAEVVFELTPVQQIVSRFMHPMTPYQGMLLFHGVGVGKTCSAVTIAEQFLESAPHKKVIVLAPQALKENFKRTVFDLSKLKWSEADKRWKINQCTGTSYLERLGLLENPDLHTVTYRIEEDRRNRYTVTGYQAFANWVDATLKKSVPVGLTDPEARLAAENEVLRRLFSDHLIIVDEAHNLRDLTAGDVDKQAVAGEANENQGGKSLNPFLKRIVLNAEGLRLVLMTATPMYNSAPEIVLLLNYLIMNDSKKEQSKLLLSTDMLFNKDGSLKPGKQQQRLEDAARAYVSYMRGENPYTFPLRMKPLAAADAPAEMWPSVSATKNPIVLTDEDKAALNALPLVFTEPVAGSPVELQLRGATTRGSVDGETVADAMLDLRMQMANITYPNTMFGTGGWDSYFTRSFITGTGHKLRVFTPKKEFDIDSVYSGEGLRTHAPKIHRIIESIKGARGICFVYSRYIKSGALPLATALERAGFQRRLADGRIAPLLKGVPAVPPVCAVCGSVSAGHPAEHTFKPACYVLLTSEDDISPNFAGLVRQATSWTDDDGPLGSNVKVVIGSQVASEGLDLKCIREMHILDSWYHLNRTDQIIGRAIRYCSHSALRAVETRQGLDAMTLNNCLIYMHATRVPETEAGPAFETADMYAYRIAIGKAQMVGKVQRLLKKNAWDCNLELEAITFVGLPPKKQIDAQGAERKSLNDDGTEMDGYDINDQDYTTYCDYQVCKHQCVETIVEAGLHLDTSTFDITDARRIVLAKQDIVRGLFADTIMVPETTIKELFGDMPWELASEALMELIDGRRFRLTRPDGVEGFLIKKAGYLVFQPSGVTDTDIPMTLRYARGFQLQRHFMTPHMPVWGRAEEAGPAPVPAAKKTEPGPAPGPSSAILEKWTEWLTFVNSGGKEKLPSTLSSTQRIWSWFLDHYAAIPELRGVALQWWFDNIISFEEQKSLLEVAITDAGPVVDSLRSILDPNILRTKSTVAYRLFNPVNASVELFCTQPQSNTFKACTSNTATSVDKLLGNTPVKYITPDAETGPYFGFITTKSKKLVFKTLDTKSTKTPGAECGNASNLGDHHLRVLAFHEAGRGNAELAPLMLEDTEESWDEKGAKARMASMKPAHMKDITHQPLCLYIEFLARLFDARRVNGKRWFLNAIVASQSGLKGRA